jgi:putative ABC transport system ATP-binding protein
MQRGAVRRCSWLHPRFGIPGYCAPLPPADTVAGMSTQPSVPDPVISIRGVTKSYQAGGPPALDDVSLEVADGEVAAIMGPSGSGKSTLLHLIAGLDRPSTGTVEVAGQRIDHLGETALARFRARHVGIVFQFFNLLDDLTVEDNVLLPAQLAGASRGRARKRAAELLGRLGIEEHRDAYPARLSGGQRQRVAIARALVNVPELLLADEPTGALDTAAGAEIGRLLAELNAAGQTLVLITHDPALAARHAARTIELVDGRVVSDRPAPRAAPLTAPLTSPFTSPGAGR